MKFIKWHKEVGEVFMKKLNIDWYTVAWVSWVKGLISGFIIYHFLL